MSYDVFLRDFSFFFFFKQKTAYEMRISDWSSDVCSSDLRAWALHVGEVLLAVGDQLALELRARVGHLDGLHLRLDLLAEVLVGHAEDGYVGHLRVQGEDVLGILGVHVHTAGDDHVRLDVGEVKEPVLRETAAVPRGRTAEARRLTRAG